MRYDVIVIGAGPGGCTAALTAARAGMKVALIERHSLPRHKTCGGGVPLGVSEHLPDFNPADYADCTIRYMRHTFRFGRALTAPIHASPQEVSLTGLWCVRRDVFDHALATAAAEAGAEVRDALTLENLTLDRTGVLVNASNRDHSSSWSATASYVIGADGANGMTARLSRLQPVRAEAIAMEALVPHTWGSGHPDLRPDTIHLEYGAVRDGYAWVFPNSDQLNIGAGLLRRNDRQRGPGIRETLIGAIRDFARALGLDVPWSGVRLYAHPLPVWTSHNKLHTADGRVLLVGDAAALVNPLFGDGILNAVVSGRLAVECILSGKPETYTERVRQTIGRELQAAARLATLFYRLPEECFRFGVTRPTATRTAALLLNGRLRYTELAPRALRRLMSAIAGRAL